MPVFQLTDQVVFPHPDLAEENGLLAVGGDLRPQRLVAGYRRGIFPWFSDKDPILWWFTSPRLVLFPDELKLSARLRRYFRNTSLSFSADRAFEEVITACGQTRKSRNEETWITPEMVAAYTTMHRLGYGHSVECWDGDTLVGGLYGIALGRVFFGESMFSIAANSSKFALIHLVRLLRRKGYRLIDCQMTTNHLVSMGAREIAGKEFQHLLQKHIHTLTPEGTWSDDAKH